MGSFHLLLFFSPSFLSIVDANDINANIVSLSVTTEATEDEERKKKICENNGTVWR